MPNSWEDDPWRLADKYRDLIKLTPEGQAIERLVAAQPDEITVKPPADEEGVGHDVVHVQESTTTPSTPQSPPFLKQLAAWPPQPSEKQKEVVPVSNPYQKQPVPLKPGDGVEDFGNKPIDY